MNDTIRIAKALLEELATVASDEGHDPAWIRGYVAGIANAAAITFELDEEQERKR
ncbi:MAG: hypothetical protein KHX02_00745 [Collinsella stercoris]|nr:hypothetical protein [Collinsella stercoris]